MKIIYIILFSSFIFSTNKHLDDNFYDTSTNSDKLIEQAKYFKIQSMREALAKVWGLDEYITKEGSRKKVNGGDDRRVESKKEANKSGHDEDDEEETNGKKGKKGKADTGTGKPAAIEIDPTIKDSKGY